MSDTICILPFIHLYTAPTGEVKPCSIAGGFDTPLNLKTLTIEEAFNSSQMNGLRKDMLEGTRNKVCDICYSREDLNGVSPRSEYNKNILWKMPVVMEDYSTDSQFQHIDIRFSNLCNFKCRMCHHDFSSNWYEDSEKLRPGFTKDRTKVMKVSDTIIEDLIPHLKNIKSIYFAGGEPLIMPEHYKLLRYLYDTLPVIEQQWGSVRPLSIHYHTNLSEITYVENSLVDLWIGFDRVFLSISCDGIGEVGEYQRVGFQHEKFVQNLTTIQKYFKPESSHTGGMGMQYNFQYTTTIWNVYHIFDFIKFMIENKFIGSSEHIDFHYAQGPFYVSLNNITTSEKERVVNFLKDGMKDIVIKKTIGELNNLINFINSNETMDNSIDTVVGFTSKLDKMNNTDVTKLNGVDFNKIKLEISSKIVGNID